MIPRIIHQTWKDQNVPAVWRPFQASWSRHHPGWEYRLWTDSDNRRFLAEHYAWFLPIYDHYPQRIMRVDSVRCFILHHFGGVYADLDYECLRPFDTLLSGKTLVLGWEPTSHTLRFQAQQSGLACILSNAIMASAPGHPFWEHVFKALVGSHLETNPLDATGPFLLTKVHATYPDQAGVTIEPPDVLVPLDEGTVWDSETNRTAPPAPPPTAYGIHHWQGTWWRVPTMRWEAHQAAKVADLAGKTGARMGDLLGGEVRRRKEHLRERFFPHKVRFQRFLTRVTSPISLSVMPEAATRMWYQVTQQDEVVVTAVLDVDPLLRFVAALAEPPPVTAIMVTKGRAALAQRAVRNFQKQVYPRCELLILDDDEDSALQNWVQAQGDDRIRHIRLPAAKRSLGALRNIGVEMAPGDYVVQWDDDDISHPHRLAVEVGLVVLHQADACFLQREMLWAPGQRRLAISCRRLWEGSFLARKATLPPYPDMGKGEDSPVADAIARGQRAVLVDAPHLYTYVFHDRNTHEAAHFHQHWEAATATYEGGAYDVAIRRLQDDVDLDLGTWITGEPATRYDQPIRVQGPRRPPALPAYPDVLILTPVKNGAADIPTYLHNLRTLDYPHDKLAIAFLEGDSTDGSYDLLAGAVPGLDAEFRSARLFREDTGYHSELPRWAPSQQRQRRGAISQSRNALLMHALGDEPWVLWIDVDLEAYPVDVLRHLLAVGKDIVVPHCVLPDGRTFDLNTFKLKPGAATWDWTPYLVDGILQPPLGFGRYYLGDFDGEDMVELDSVGGTMLLVRADVHRHGAIFPAVPYRGLVDTEGFAALARDMGHSSWGLPWLTIQHPAR